MLFCKSLKKRTYLGNRWTGVIMYDNKSRFPLLIINVFSIIINFFFFLWEEGEHGKRKKRKEKKRKEKKRKEKKRKEKKRKKKITEDDFLFVKETFENLHLIWFLFELLQDFCYNY